MKTTALALQTVCTTTTTTDCRRLTSPADQVAFYNRCRTLARSKGYPAEVFEDFPSWALIRVTADGAKGTISQLFIDYLRGTWGASGSEGQALRKAVNGASALSETVEDLGATEGGDALSELLVVEIVDGVEGRDRDILDLLLTGATNLDIAEALGVTPGRASQLVKRLQLTLRARHAED